jgi:hypothetical protein
MGRAAKRQRDKETKGYPRAVLNNKEQQNVNRESWLVQVQVLEIGISAHVAMVGCPAARAGAASN